MASKRAKTRPWLEALETRLAMSASHAPVATAVDLGAPNVVDTLAVLTAFTKAYLSRAGEPNYNAAFDLNHNGQIGQSDGKLLLRSLPPLSPKVPITLSVAIAPEDRFNGRHHPTNSGGVTFSKTPTVVGHTTPGALLFTGTGTLDLKLRGPAYVADARGNFSIKLTMTDGINQFDLQAVDPYGQQTLRAFPILWLGFGKFEAAHPRKT